MTERAVPARLAEDGEAAPMASPGPPTEGRRLRLSVEPPRADDPATTPDGPDGPSGPAGPDGPAQDDVEQIPHARAEQGSEDELVQLRRAMRTRPVIDMARGVLMASFGLSAEDAWRVLVAVSQNTNTKLHTVAHDLVTGVTGEEIPKPLRRQLAAAIAGLQAPSAPLYTHEG
ncbi:ANTAR domain-containing protein [Streptomyces longisporoflavus]|uniref:ANTAR domain-containing protein n=1 Tax=Streptomyces longisporoflavus TaxID=28044 RepID=A0ABW7QFY0_9ACTN